MHITRQQHTRRLAAIQIRYTDETCAWSELWVLMDSKAASKLLLQNKHLSWVLLLQLNDVKWIRWQYRPVNKNINVIVTCVSWLEPTRFMP